MVSLDLSCTVFDRINSSSPLKPHMIIKSYSVHCSKSLFRSALKTFAPWPVLAPYLHHSSPPSPPPKSASLQTPCAIGVLDVTSGCRGIRWWASGGPLHRKKGAMPTLSSSSSEQKRKQTCSRRHALPAHIVGVAVYLYYYYYNIRETNRIYSGYCSLSWRLCCC